MGPEPFKFTADGGGTRLNLMDPLISRGSGIQGQTMLLNAVARIVRNDTPSTEWEKKAIRDALELTFDSFEDGRVPTPADLLPNLGKIKDRSELSEGAQDRLHMAGLSIKYAIEDLLKEYGGLLDGETSRGVDLTHKLTTFDISQLPDDGPAVPVVMAIGNMWLMGRLRSERGRITNVVYEEGWHMIGGPSAHLIKSNQKLSRSLGISNVFVMHKGTDIPPDSPGYTVVQEAQTIDVFNQARRRGRELGGQHVRIRAGVRVDPDGPPAGAPDVQIRVESGDPHPARPLNVGDRSDQHRQRHVGRGRRRRRVARWDG